MVKSPLAIVSPPTLAGTQKKSQQGVPPRLENGKKFSGPWGGGRWGRDDAGSSPHRAKRGRRQQTQQTLRKMTETFNYLKWIGLGGVSMMAHVYSPITRGRGRRIESSRPI